MNYRHAYHAGNFADVVKHVSLLLVLEHLKKKPEPFCYLDTHAGIGGYDLAGAEAQRTREYRGGIGKLLQARDLPPPLADYVRRVLGADARNTPERLLSYPGSPALAVGALRPQDRAVLVELHPLDADTLKAAFRGESRVAVHHMDGYHGLKAFVPPKQRRGLVLVDPPFEQEDEFDRLLEGLKQAYLRWASGIYALWYPVKDRRDVFRFFGGLKRSGIRKILSAELCLYPDDRVDRLNGSGLVFVNPPWQLDRQLQGLLRILGERLAEPGQARVNVGWLVPE